MTANRKNITFPNTSGVAAGWACGPMFRLAAPKKLATQLQERILQQADVAI